MKKGLSYIDWTISIGLFIIFLIIIFILFQPAILSGEDKEYLALIVKDGLENKSFVALDAYPIFIDGDGSSKSIKLTPLPINPLQGKTFVVFENGTKILFNSESNIIHTESIYLPPRIFTIWMITSDQIFNTDPFAGPVTSSQVNLSIGINQQIRGFYPENYNNTIHEIDYSILKSQFNFPQNRNFQIYIYNSSSLEVPQFSYNEEEPNPFDRVKTLFYSSNSIEIAKDGEPIKKQPIFILIRAW